MVFLRYLDKRFFGDRGRDVPNEDLWKTRVYLLSGKKLGGLLWSQIFIDFVPAPELRQTRHI